MRGRAVGVKWGKLSVGGQEGQEARKGTAAQGDEQRPTCM